nr:MAG TPA: hypothetical protein [Caudoviricetes sp.]
MTSSGLSCGMSVGQSADTPTDSPRKTCWTIRGISVSEHPSV